MHWIAPPLGALKLNIDTAWRSGEAALAILAREKRAEPKGLWFSRTCLNIEWAEAKVLLRACQIGVTLRAQEVIIEFDSKVIEAALGLRRPGGALVYSGDH